MSESMKMWTLQGGRQERKTLFLLYVHVTISLYILNSWLTNNIKINMLSLMLYIRRLALLSKEGL